MFSRPVLMSLAVVSVMLGSGCRSDTPKEASRSSPPATATPSLGSGDAAKRDALAAYRGMWDSFVEAAKTSNPEAPDLPKFASGKALQLIASALYTSREKQQVILGEIKIDPKVTGATPANEPTQVNILDCVNDEKWLEYKKSGGLVDDKPGSASRTTAVVNRTGEGWKVSLFTIGDQPC